MRQQSGTQQVVKFILREGMKGAWIKKDDWVKWSSLAKHMIEEVPGGADEICRVAKSGMQHVWPYSDGRAWTIFDLWKNYSAANAEANARRLEAENIDLAEGPDAEA
jgi:hypothetical protein